MPPGSPGALRSVMRVAGYESAVVGAGQRRMLAGAPPGSLGTAVTVTQYNPDLETTQLVKVAAPS